ncbi:MAG TPA: phosphoribosylamine--glycine ligase [Ignavibacteriaceae bacterium]|nr:phosphoribosylamine--glycine ligase [Ignavibacteriaceae bacterium]
MNVLVLGSGGREHALAWRISKSKLLKNLFISPGNPGTAGIGKNVELEPGKQNIAEFCKTNDIDLVVIGPEQPLVEGLADFLRSENIKVFGPDGKAAEIEGSKSFAKELMQKYSVPTAAYKEFDNTEYGDASVYLKDYKFPAVIKADGLAAGKGVIICNNFIEAENALKEIFVEKAFGGAGSKIIIEEFLEGEEASILAVTDGDDYVLLPSSQDHKRIGEGDTGKNTGGMGAYSPAPVITSRILNEIESKIIEPVLEGMKKEGRKFSGCLYAGLMITSEGPKVIEFNCRFGDPETQAVLPLVGGDFLKLLYSAASGKLDKKAVNFPGGTAVCVVAVSGGYPGSYKKGLEILGLEDTDTAELIVFHAGTSRKEYRIITSGGRVLGVTAVLKENDLQKARTLAYGALSRIKFKDMYYRRDIGIKALKRES